MFSWLFDFVVVAADKPNGTCVLSVEVVIQPGIRIISFAILCWSYLLLSVFLTQ